MIKVRLKHPKVMDSYTECFQDKAVHMMKVEVELFTYPAWDYMLLFLKESTYNKWEISNICVWNKKNNQYESINNLYSPILKEEIINSLFNILERKEKRGA